MSNNYSAERSDLWKLIAEVILSKYPSCPVVPLSWLQVHVTKMKTPDANYQESRLQEGKEMQQLRNVLDVRLIGFLACYILQTHWLNVGLAPGKRRKSISWKQKLTLTPAFRESDAPHRGVLPWYSPINFHKRTSLVSIVEAQECVFFFALCESPCLPGDRMINPMERVWSNLCRTRSFWIAWITKKRDGCRSIPRAVCPQNWTSSNPECWPSGALHLHQLNSICCFRILDVFPGSLHVSVHLDGFGWFSTTCFPQKDEFWT